MHTIPIPRACPATNHQSLINEPRVTVPCSIISIYNYFTAVKLLHVRLAQTTSSITLSNIQLSSHLLSFAVLQARLKHSRHNGPHRTPQMPHEPEGPTIHYAHKRHRRRICSSKTTRHKVRLLTHAFTFLSETLTLRHRQIGAVNAPVRTGNTLRCMRCDSFISFRHRHIPTFS